MQHIQSLSGFIPLSTQSACALGIFDGVHVGHMMVLEAALRRAKTQNLTSVVYTFSNHPQSVLSKTPTKLLTTLDERLALFEAMGFDMVLAPEFNDETRNQSAEDFTAFLKTGLNTAFVSVGYDHRFGKNRQGDGDFLKAQSDELGFDVEIIEPVHVGKQIVSSTLIRKLLTYGDVEQAETLLGRPYAISGNVIKGQARGASIGFPTANILEDPLRLLPANGVYVGQLQLLDAPGQPYLNAIANVGVCPTFNSDTDRAQQLEVHVFDFDSDLYGQRVAFHFLKHLRSEQAFPSVTALIEQIIADCEQAKRLFAQ